MTKASTYPAETGPSGDVTSFVPLTTRYTYSPSCSEAFRLNGPSLVAFDPGYGLDIDSDMICQPGAVTTWWEQARLGINQDEHTAVSLGPMKCPSGWSTLASSTKDKSSTLAMCCPPGYTLNGGVEGSITGDCLSKVRSGDVLAFASTSTDTEVWIMTTETLKTSSVVGAIAVVGWNIEIEETSTPGSSTTESATSTTASSDTQENTSATGSPDGDNNDNNSGGVPLATSVGVSVGVVCGVLLLVGFGVFFWRRRRRQKKLAALEAGGAGGATPGTETQQAYPPTSASPYVNHKFGDPNAATPFSELPSGQRASELPAEPHSVNELDAGQYTYGR
ncbi:hypothetical protein MKZ38_000630 [Zalerion maritima]|uniref:Uncharacterized protein n=1 Tax=Zalerion maritima TaxID=339359 RepID=A0AAD5RSM7_9PEZI|nr:hypothetical protein MKZ38_000630 [Zalerion maritima]